MIMYIWYSSMLSIDWCPAQYWWGIYIFYKYVLIQYPSDCSSDGVQKYKFNQEYIKGYMIGPPEHGPKNDFSHPHSWKVGVGMRRTPPVLRLIDYIIGLHLSLISSIHSLLNEPLEQPQLFAAISTHRFLHQLAVNIEVRRINLNKVS